MTESFFGRVISYFNPYALMLSENKKTFMKTRSRIKITENLFVKICKIQNYRSRCSKLQNNCTRCLLIEGWAIA